MLINKRYYSALIFFLLIGTVFLYVPNYVRGQTSPAPIEFTYGMDYYPLANIDSLDPHNSWGNDVIDQVVETLFYYDLTDPELNIIPRLATGGIWLADGLIYEVYLKTGIFFHDGTPFNADAVKWNFDRLFDFFDSDPYNQIYGAYHWPDMVTPIIESVQKVNDYTVRFILTQPFAPIDALLCFSGSSIVSKFSTPRYDYIDTLTGDLVGTGPFVYDEFIDNEFSYDEFKFTAYDNYKTTGSGPAYIDILTFKIIPPEYHSNNRIDRTEATQALIDGVVDFVKDPEITMLQDLRNNPDITLVDAGQKTSLYYFGMNNYFIPDEMREAISYALDYDRIIQEAAQGEGVRLRSPIPLGIRYANWGFNVPGTGPIEENIVEARNVLIASGEYGDLPPPEFTPENNALWEGLAASEETATGTYKFSYHWSSGDYRMALLYILQESLAQIGVRIEDDKITWGEFVSRLAVERDLLHMYFLPWRFDFNDPYNLFNTNFADGVLNGAQVHDTIVNQKIAQAMTERNPVLREDIYDEIQQRLIEVVYPWCWLFSPKNYDAYSNRFRGFQSNPMDKVWFYSFSPWNLITEDFTFTSDITIEEGDGLIVGADGITIDGEEGFKLIGPGYGIGINLNGHSGVTIRDIHIEGFDFGVWVGDGTGNTITVNYITKINEVAIALIGASDTTITNNILVKNHQGVYANPDSTSNDAYLNLFINNNIQMLDEGQENLWWSPALGLGNFWSNYWGKDLDGDGIGDTDLPHEGVDYRPLLDPSIPYKYDLLPFGEDWWNHHMVLLVWRGGWSPVDIQMTDSFGRVISRDINEIGLHAFYVEELQPDGTKSIMVIIAIPDQDLPLALYSFQMTALDDLTYSMGMYAFQRGNTLHKRSVVDIPLSMGQTRAIETRLITDDVVLENDISCSGDGLIVVADNIVVDGGYHKLSGSGLGTGIILTKRNGVTLTNIMIENFDTAIDIKDSVGNDIKVNYIKDNNIALKLSSAEDAEITNNIIVGNNIGITNDINSANNKIFANLLINNIDHAQDSGGNVWVHPTYSIGNFWSNYWGKDDGSNGGTAGDYVGDTHLPHEGVDYAPLLDPSIPYRLDLLPFGGNWWNALTCLLVWRGGWSPVDIQASDPLGRIISREENQIGLEAFFIEDNEWEPGITKIMIIIATSLVEPSLWGEYSLQMTALEDLDYSMEWFASDVDGIIFERSVEDVPMTAGQINQVVMTLEVTPSGDISVSPEPQYTFGGILPPINPDGLSIFKQGRTIPVKFQLFDDVNFPVGTAHATIEAIKISDGIEGYVWEYIPPEEYDEGNVFRYDVIDQQYVFNLRTRGLERGTYLLKIALDDGQIFTVQISLAK